MTPSEIRWREKYSDKKERMRERDEMRGGCVREEDCRSVEQLGVVEWGRCVFMVRGESCDHLKRVCS